MIAILVSSIGNIRKTFVFKRFLLNVLTVVAEYHDNSTTRPVLPKSAVLLQWIQFHGGILNHPFFNI